jgi:hypothetical protein
MLRRSHTHTKEQYSVEEQSIHAWTVEHDVTKEDVELLLQHGYLKYNTIHNIRYVNEVRQKMDGNYDVLNVNLILLNQFELIQSLRIESTVYPN